jgi:hypothetical protein
MIIIPMPMTIRPTMKKTHGTVVYCPLGRTEDPPKELRKKYRLTTIKAIPPSKIKMVPLFIYYYYRLLQPAYSDELALTSLLAAIALQLKSTKSFVAVMLLLPPISFFITFLILIVEWTLRYSLLVISYIIYWIL